LVALGRPRGQLCGSDSVPASWKVIFRGEGSPLRGLAGWECREGLVDQHWGLILLFLRVLGRPRLLPPPCHQRLVAGHAEDSLRRSCVSEILDLAFAVPASEARRAESLVACEDSQILDLIAAGAAAVCTIIADERAITEEEEVRIGVEEGPAGITPETV
jgi:hypothetical protein